MYINDEKICKFYNLYIKGHIYYMCIIFLSIIKKGKRLL